MDRGRIQVLFHFLPGKTFDWEKGIAICKVSEIEGTENKTISKKYVLEEAAKVIGGWPQERRRFFPDFKNTDSYILVEPERVIADVFPLLFECKGCKRVKQFTSAQDFRNQGNTLGCKKCGQAMIQIHHVLVHECGEIAPLYVPSCPLHGKDDMMLDDRGSQTYSNFKWVCKVCNNPINIGLNRSCTCTYKNLKNKRMVPAVHRSSNAYIPLNITLVNIQDDKLEALLKDESHPEILLAAHLGLFNHPNTKVAELLADDNSSSNNHVEELMRMIQSLPESMRAGHLQMLEQLKNDISTNSVSERQRIINEIKVVIKDWTISPSAVRELLEFVYPMENYSIVSFEKLKEQFLLKYPEELPRIDKYKNEVTKRGFSRIELIQNFPVLNVMLGYTRLERDKDSSVIRSFPNIDGKQPFYINSLETEAIMFTLDPLRVLEWLERNNPNFKYQGVRDNKHVKAWFVQNISEIDKFGEVTEKSAISEQVIGLVHSMSHALIRQASVLSGFDRGSMSEYLFPKMLSFAIYANSQQAATMGGMHSMFEQSLEKWLRDTYINGNKCVYDPVCHEHNGACHSCLYLAETSCRHANRTLSRNLLFGGAADNHMIDVGYWEM